MGPTLGTQVIWGLWHWQSLGEQWENDDDEVPYLLAGHFARRDRAEAAGDRLRLASGLKLWPHGWRLREHELDGEGGWEQGFAGWWDDGGPRADPNDILVLPDAPPAILPRVVLDLWHFKRRRASDAIEPVSAKGIGLFSSLANAAAAIAHRRRQPGFCDWPEGFRIFRRRLDVAFGLDGFQGRYGWEAWRDSLRGEGRAG